MAIYKVKTEGKEYDVTVEDDGLGGASVTVEGEHFHVESGANTPVARQGSSASLPPAPPVPSHPQHSTSHAASAAPAGAGSITAPIPGIVTSLLVKAGEQVSAGQTVLKLEAMKMENDIAAPVAGTVQDIPVSEGAQVADGQLLMVIS